MVEFAESAHTHVTSQSDTLVEHSRREEATSLTQEVRGSTYRHVWGGLYLIIASLAVLYIVTAPVLLIDECFRDVSRS